MGLCQYPALSPLRTEPLPLLQALSLLTGQYQYLIPSSHHMGPRHCLHLFSHLVGPYLCLQAHNHLLEHLSHRLRARIQSHRGQAPTQL